MSKSLWWILYMTLGLGAMLVGMLYLIPDQGRKARLVRDIEVDFKVDDFDFRRNAEDKAVKELFFSVGADQAAGVDWIALQICRRMDDEFKSYRRMHVQATLKPTGKIREYVFAEEELHKKPPSRIIVQPKRPVTSPARSNNRLLKRIRAGVKKAGRTAVQKIQFSSPLAKDRKTIGLQYETDAAGSLRDYDAEIVCKRISKTFPKSETVALTVNDTATGEIFYYTFAIPAGPLVTRDAAPSASGPERPSQSPAERPQS